MVQKVSHAKAIQKKRVGRPKGSKTKNKATVELKKELLMLKGIINELRQMIDNYLPLTYLLLDGHFGNNYVAVMSQQVSLQLISTICINAISVVEENPPAGEKGIEWTLLTTLRIDNYDALVTYIRWYSYRWLIERYHYVLKSGCGVEKLQLETADRIKKALATYAIVAFRLLWLLYESRNHPNISCELIFSQDEWQSLYCYLHKKPRPPNQVPTIKTELSGLPNWVVSWDEKMMENQASNVYGKD